MTCRSRNRALGARRLKEKRELLPNSAGNRGRHLPDRTGKPVIESSLCSAMAPLDVPDSVGKPVIFSAELGWKGGYQIETALPPVRFLDLFSSFQPEPGWKTAPHLAGSEPELQRKESRTWLERGPNWSGGSIPNPAGVATGGGWKVCRTGLENNRS